MNISLMLISSAIGLSAHSADQRIAMLDELLEVDAVASECTCQVTQLEGETDDGLCFYAYDCTNGEAGETTASCDIEQATEEVTDIFCG